MIMADNQQKLFAANIAEQEAAWQKKEQSLFSVQDLISF